VRGWIAKLLKTVPPIGLEIALPLLAGAIAFVLHFDFWLTLTTAGWIWSICLRAWDQEDQSDLLRDNNRMLRKLVGKSPRVRKRPENISTRTSKKVETGTYFVDFRARTAASYGHAFAWYGRTDQKEIEVAGLHPASDSIIPYVLGHLIPVPSETGASYGDLDEQYLTASYRVLMDEEQAARVFAYIKDLQSNSLVWHAAAYNCVSFLQNIAQHMGLQVPGNHLLMPEKWVVQLRDLNSREEIGLIRDDGIPPRLQRRPLLYTGPAARKHPSNLFDGPHLAGRRADIAIAFDVSDVSSRHDVEIAAAISFASVRDKDPKFHCGV